MRARPKGQQFHSTDLEAYLTAFGDDLSPLPETVKCLDEIVTDFIIETCHSAAQCASYSHRAKIKVDDFKFALRKDPKKLGRVNELLGLEKEIKRNRKAFDVEDQIVAKEGKGALVKDIEEGRKKRKYNNNKADGSTKDGK